MVECSLCNKFRGTSFKTLLRHIGEIHRFDPNLCIRCGLQQCPLTYNNFESFRSHVYRKHRELLHSDESETQPSSSSSRTSNSGTSGNDGTDDHVDQGGSGNLGNSDMETTSAEDLGVMEEHHVAARFLLKAREQYRIPQSTLNSLLEDISALYSSALDNVKKACVRKLQVTPDTDMNSAWLSDCFTDCGSLFQGLSTENQQTAYFKRNFNYLEPTERVIARYLKEKNGKLKESVDCSYDIDLLSSLRALLKMTSVQEQIMNCSGSGSDCLMDYCDGELFKQNPLFQEDPCALQIQLYYDELEVCNPLGSYAKKHKLGCLYYTLGNFNPKFRSSLKSIHMLCIIKHSYVVKHGIDVVLQPVVDAVKKLEEAPGVKFDFDGRIVFFRGTVTVFSADNLAAWSIGGYKALASAFRKCQYCMVADHEMQHKFNENELQLRTEELYREHCRGLVGPLKDHISTTFGIVRNSILNDLNYFHVVRGLVPDIMHNILEGTLKVCIQQLLFHYITEKKFTLDLLNSRIESFRYGPDITNKPSLIDSRHLVNGLKQSASQMWCLARFLPLMIGDQIEEDDLYWQNYLTHLHIVDEVFAPVTDVHRTKYLEMLIEDFLYDFKCLYPNRPLTPKMHYLIHLPTWIRWCGPLIRFWCMRYEAKHSFFKQMSTVVRNFKNIPKTLASRHQHYMCYVMLDDHSYLTSQTSYTCASVIFPQELEYYEALVETYPEINNTTVWSVSSATVGGTMYKQGYVVCYDVDDDEPFFGVIEQCLVTANEETLFVLRELHTLCWNEHYHSYEVVKTNAVIVVNHKKFIDHHPLHLCQLLGKNTFFICLKYHLFLSV